MPFVSEAQRRKFYATPSLHKYVSEYEAATPKGAKLPQHVDDPKKQLHQAAIQDAIKRRK